MGGRPRPIPALPADRRPGCVRGARCARRAGQGGRPRGWRGGGQAGAPFPGDAVSESVPPLPCSIDELRTLFLFEKLTEDQLGWLCREGRVERIGPGLVFGEGEPADCFYVLLDGEVVLSRRVGADDVEITRTSDRGVYAGAMQV